MKYYALGLFHPNKPKDFQWNLYRDFGVVLVNAWYCIRSTILRSAQYVLGHYLIGNNTHFQIEPFFQHQHGGNLSKSTNKHVCPSMPSMNTNFPTPNADIQPHTITEPPPCLIVGLIFLIFKASFGFLHTMRHRPSGPKRLNLLSSLNMTVHRKSKDLVL